MTASRHKRLARTGSTPPRMASAADGMRQGDQVAAEMASAKSRVRGDRPGSLVRARQGDRSW
jgi:hypothetical protein